MLNILIVSTGDTIAPTSGGPLRVHSLGRELAEIGHHVDMMSFVVRNHTARAKQAGERLHIQVDHTIWLDLAAAADRLRAIPITKLAFWLRPLRRRLARQTTRKQYDVVHFEWPWFSGLYDAVGGGARIVYGAQNIESDWWGEKLRRYPMSERWRRRLKRHELEAARRAHGLAVCTQADRDWFVREGDIDPRRIERVPNGFDADRTRPPDPEMRQRLREQFGFAPDEKIALFVGTDALPNRRAVETILGTIAPAIVDPRVRIVVVGRVGKAFRAGAGASDRVTFTGPVDDVLPWLQAADVGLNPVTEGSGSNVKLAEYCGAGLPVVTTEVGLRGFEDLRPWVTVCEAGGFAKAILAARWPAEIPADQRLALSWHHSARRLANLYSRILQNRIDRHKK